MKKYFVSMKDYLIAFAIMVGICASALWAHNNVENNVENILPKWGRIKSKM